MNFDDTPQEAVIPQPRRSVFPRRQCDAEGSEAAAAPRRVSRTSTSSGLAPGRN